MDTRERLLVSVEASYIDVLLFQGRSQVLLRTSFITRGIKYLQLYLDWCGTGDRALKLCVVMGVFFDISVKTHCRRISSEMICLKIKTPDNFA